MIPETGTRKQFKAAVFAVCERSPVAGEVYELKRRGQPTIRYVITGWTDKKVFYEVDDMTASAWCYLEDWYGWLRKGIMRFWGYDPDWENRQWKNDDSRDWQRRRV